MLLKIIGSRLKKFSVCMRPFGGNGSYLSASHVFCTALSGAGLSLQVAGAGVDGSNATCVDVNAMGGLTFIARGGSTTGYQPFISSNADTVSFYVKQTSASDLGGNAIAAIPPNVRAPTQSLLYSCMLVVRPH